MMTDRIIEDYEAFVEKLNSIDVVYDRAMEAAGDETTTSNEKTTDTTNPKPVQDVTDNQKNNTTSVDNADAKSAEQKGQEFMEALTNALEALADTIREMLNKITNQISLLIQTDKGFLKEYLAAKKNYKPSTGQEFIIYEYKNAGSIENLRRYFNSIVKNHIAEFSTNKVGSKLPDTSIFEVKEEDFDKTVLTELKAPSSVTSLKEYFNILLGIFRGKKQKIIIRPSDLDVYDKIGTMDTKKLQSLLNADKNEVYQAISKITTNLKLVKNNRGISDEGRARAKKYAKRVIRLEKMYNSFLDFYYRAKIEQIVSARGVLKAMYKI